jgi:hypothetical protein
MDNRIEIFSILVERRAAFGRQPEFRMRDLPAEGFIHPQIAGFFES